MTILSMPRNVFDLKDLELSEGNPSEHALHNEKNCPTFHCYSNILFVTTAFFLTEYECLWDKMFYLMSDECPSNKFFKEGKKILQNMQGNIQARKYKNHWEELTKNSFYRKSWKNCFVELNHNTTSFLKGKHNLQIFQLSPIAKQIWRRKSDSQNVDLQNRSYLDNPSWHRA